MKTYNKYLEDKGKDKQGVFDTMKVLPYEWEKDLKKEILEETLSKEFPKNIDRIIELKHHLSLVINYLKK